MGRNQRFENAQKHTALVEQIYSNEIKKCIEDTRVYGVDFVRSTTTDSSATFKLEQSYTQKSVLRHSEEGKLAILNFASYRHPGGGFINGSLAQEEALCHASFLYNVLREFPDYYEWNVNNYNKGLYMNRALYSPDVYFFKESEEEYIKAYMDFLKMVRKDNPGAHITAALGIMGDGLYHCIEEAVKQYSEETGDINVSALRFTPQDGSTGYAADWHPTEATNEIAAKELTEHIRAH